MAKTYKFNRYRTEARAEPFVLETDDGAISIPPPDGDTVLEIEESRSSRRTLELLCGDQQYDQVYELIRHEPASVLNAIVADMVEHFGLAAVPPGGTRASSR